MKKVAYILPYLAGGGTETHVLELIKGFTGEYEITVLAPPGPRLKEFTRYDLKYISFTSFNDNLFKGLREFKQGIRKIIADQTEIVHIHAAHELVLLARLLLRKHKIPVIFTVHGYQQKFDYRLSSIFSNLFADEVITVSLAEKQELIKAGIKEEKLNLIYNGLTVPESYSVDNLPEPIISLVKAEKKIIGTVGRLEETKGIHVLINAFYELNNPDTHLLIIGRGSMEEKLKDQVEKLGLTSRVTFTGYSTRVHDYLEAMDIFVLPSFQEAFGLVCIEAMAHQLPVIATHVGGIPELVKEGETGIIVPPNDVSSLVDAIEKLLRDDELAEKMGKAGYDRYKKCFNIEVMLEKTRELYDQCI